MQLLQKVNTKLLYGIVAGILIAAMALAVCVLLPAGNDPITKYKAQVHLPRRARTGYYEGVSFQANAQGFLTSPDLQTRCGIDVSGFQGRINWQQVADAGVEFVFIRLGGRGTTEGGLYTDDYAQGYYEGAREAGLDVGVYFFSQAVTPEEAKQEARFVLELIEGWQLEMPVVYDWEWVSDDARTAQLTGTELTVCTAAFCQEIDEAGYRPMIYFNSNQGRNMLSLEKLKQYPFWLAWYDDTLEFPDRVDCWQYSCTGTVPGIDTDVDLNLWITE